MGTANLPNGSMAPIRIDKWLWAARFFKTRSLAKSAVEKGKILVDGVKVKPSRTVKTGDVLTIQQGHIQKVVHIIALDDRRKGAPEAAKLYHETEESVSARENASILRKSAALSTPKPEKRPTKKERRQIIQFNQTQHD